MVPTATRNDGERMAGMADKFWLSSPGKRLEGLWASRNFRESAGNAFYSVAEYIAQPLSMLLAAPFLVHRLGLNQYGIWMLVSAILGSMGTGHGSARREVISDSPKGMRLAIFEELKC
jgi:hypothetical protein